MAATHIKQIKVGTTNYYIDADMLDGKHVSDIVIQTQTINCNNDSNQTKQTYSIEPNKFYIFENVNVLTVLFNTPTEATRLNNYMFQITFGSTGSTLTLPSYIKWANGNSIASEGVEKNGVYQISVINGLGVFSKFN
jgi:hypothetical protein